MPFMRCHRSGWRRGWKAWVTAAAVSGAVMTVGAVVAPALAPTRADRVPPAAARSGSPAVRYYIVPPAVGGHPEFLYQIAAQVLGDGGRYGEIFRLNRGRPQPDGRRLETPTSVDPGWILILPSDAAGPGTHVGIPPKLRVPSGTPAGQPAAAASQSGAMSDVRVGLLALVVVALLAVAGIVTRRRGQARSASPGLAPEAVLSAVPPTFRPGLLPSAQAERLQDPADAGPRASGRQVTPPVHPATSALRRAPAPQAASTAEQTSAESGPVPQATASPDLASANDPPWPDYLMPPP